MCDGKALAYTPLVLRLARTGAEVLAVSWSWMIYQSRFSLLEPCWGYKKREYKVGTARHFPCVPIRLQTVSGSGEAMCHRRNAVVAKIWFGEMFPPESGKVLGRTWQSGKKGGWNRVVMTEARCAVVSLLFVRSINTNILLTEGVTLSVPRPIHQDFRYKWNLFIWSRGTDLPRLVPSHVPTFGKFAMRRSRVFYPVF